MLYGENGVMKLMQAGMRSRQEEGMSTGQEERRKGRTAANGAGQLQFKSTRNKRAIGAMLLG
jgi:hypothetical protein